ncbi:MAG: TVP38/TMEM64 family protein [Planctomycetota bacterium]|nr:MAG: TVP38/TMEM64 family protein [Planctomycetota bacterium]
MDENEHTDQSSVEGQDIDISWEQVKVYLKRLGPVSVLAAIAASMPAIGGFVLLGTVKWSAGWLQANDELGVVCYVLGFSVMAGLALLPTYAQAFVGGWAFGFQVGVMAAIGGFMGAATIGYVIARRASGDRVVTIIEEHAKWKAVCDALIGGGFWKTLGIVTLLRLPPNSPFAITNLVLASTRVPTVIYLLGTLLGLTPRTVAAVFIGVGASDLTLFGPRWLTITGIVSVIVVVIIIGTIANKAVTRVTGGEEHLKSQNSKA